MRCRLLVRDVQGSHLTERGRHLYGASQQMLDASYEVGMELLRGERDLRHNVSLSIDEGLGVHWLLPRLDEFHATYPTLDIELRCFDEPDKSTIQGADVQIQHAPPDRNGLKVVRLAYVHEQFFASHQVVAERGQPETSDDLMQFAFVDRHTVNDKDENRKELLERLPGRRVSLRTSAACAHYQAICKGCGIGLLPTYLGVLDPELVPVMDELHCRRDVFLTYRPDLGEFREIRRVIDWLKATFSPRHQPWFPERFVPVSKFGQEKGATSN